MRCRSVRAATSSRVLAKPASTNRTKAAATLVHTARPSRARLQTRAAADHRRSKLRPSDQSHGCGDADHAARAEGRIEVPGPRSAHFEHLHRQHHEQDVQRPNHQELRAQHAHEDPRTRLVGDHPPAPASRLSERALCVVPPCPRAPRGAAG